MSDDDEGINKLTRNVNLGLAHSELTKWRTDPLSEAEKDKILKSLFVSRAEYEQHVIDLREREEREDREQKAAEAREAARLENDPKHWKLMYQSVVDRAEQRNKERDRERTARIGALVVFAVVFVIVYLLGR